ncbi:uncharacterized protein TrAFT101_007823 [Trichoderma asperellum]|uniref:uncharacterized protein n=1 Tax=Trichoderma asperellum TaxID=101201 RepID=UPI003330E902|nr:hypothetical protein TrAFT101_007823 [Trichoderma asperellum]
MALDPGDTLFSCSSIPPPYYANPEHPEDYQRIAEEGTKTLDKPAPGTAKAVPFINDDGLPEVVVASSSETHDEPTQKTFTPPMESNLIETVTPLHLLGDQSDTVDCPFCRRRVVTKCCGNGALPNYRGRSGGPVHDPLEGPCHPLLSELQPESGASTLQ